MTSRVYSHLWSQVAVVFSTCGVTVSVSALQKRVSCHTYRRHLGILRQDGEYGSVIMISGPYDTTHNGLWSSNIIAQNCMCNTRTCGGGQGRVLFDEYCNGSGRSRDHLMRRECICSMSARRGVWSTRVTGYSRSTIWP